MSDQNIDPELQAMQQVIKALESLDADARTRVLAYVFQRLGLSLSTPNPIPPLLETSPTAPLSIPAILPPTGTTLADIRSLKEAKQPKSDTQMAALVAYYLKEIAPVGDRKDTISHEDIEKYFKQAGYPLPKQIRMALNNAKNAGYFDSAGASLFRLNPVGHNLVVHGMTSSAGDSGRRVRKANDAAKIKKTTKH